MSIKRITRSVAGEAEIICIRAEMVFSINIYCHQFGGYQDTSITSVIVQFRGNTWLELDPEPKLRTKVEPGINNFGSATLVERSVVDPVLQPGSGITVPDPATNERADHADNKKKYSNFRPVNSGLCLLQHKKENCR